jgi:hypothetical protein
MRPYNERLQTTAQAPCDLVDYNDQLMRREISPDEAHAYLQTHRFSWDGVEGPFRDYLVSVLSPFVVGAENLPETRHNKVIPMVGRLGAVQVVELDFRLPLSNKYHSYVLAAGLHPPSKGSDSAGVPVKTPSFVVLSFPGQDFFQRAWFNRAGVDEHVNTKKYNPL